MQLTLNRNEAGRLHQFLNDYASGEWEQLLAQLQTELNGNHAYEGAVLELAEEEARELFLFLNRNRRNILGLPHDGLLFCVLDKLDIYFIKQKHQQEKERGEKTCGK